MRLPHVSEKQIEKALIEAGGRIKDAAELLKVERTALSRRVNQNEELQGMRDEARLLAYEDGVDESERIIENARQGGSVTKAQLTSAIFTLKTHGKKRGWVERQEHTGANGAPMGLLVAPVPAQSPEEWKKQNEEARKAVGDVSP